MTHRFEKVGYSTLSAKQKENYNFHKVSAVLADYGFTAIRLNDDWNGADFLALHVGGETLKVQLKARITVSRKYQGKHLWIAAPHGGGWFIYPHDDALSLIESVASFQRSESWLVRGLYSWKSPSKALLNILQPFYYESSAAAG